MFVNLLQELNEEYPIDLRPFPNLTVDNDLQPENEALLPHFQAPAYLLKERLPFYRFSCIHQVYLYTKRQAEAAAARNELITRVMQSGIASKLSPELREAAKAGVQILAYDCTVTSDSMVIRDPVEVRL